MKYEDLRKAWKKEEQRAFSGWDFSHLDGRWWREPEGWEYRAIVKRHLRPNDKLLDMGTGGGEVLLSLGHPHENTAVTESWEPNIALCRQRLEPLGIRVYPCEGDRLPMEDSSFDIVINRHASYDLREVSRVLKAGGLFITQQVGGDNARQFAKRLVPGAEPPYADFSLSSQLQAFRAGGFAVLCSMESHPQLRFYDVGALVFWARVIEWSFPGFSVDNNFEQLCLMQDELLDTGYIAVEQHRFMIVARKEPHCSI